MSMQGVQESRITVTKLIPAARAKRCTSEATARYHFVEQVVTHVFNVPLNKLRAPTRGRAEVALTRQIAMYLTHVVFGLTLTEVGKLCGRDRTTAAHACRLVEDRRDDPAFDKFVTYLEATVRAWANARILARSSRHSN